MQEEEERTRQLQQMLKMRLEKVTPDLLSEFLFKKGIPVVKCLMCGQEDIVIPQTALHEVGPRGSTALTFVNYIQLDSSHEGRFSIINYQYRLICNNCGFTSHLSVWPVLRWIEQERGSSGE